MLQRIDRSILLRALIPLIVLPLLGIAARPHDLTRSLIAARQALEAGAPARIAANLERVVAYEPWRVELWQLAGSAALYGGEPQAAIDYLERAKALDALSPDGYLALGDAYQRIGDLDAALKSWETARSGGSDPSGIYTRLLEIHRIQADIPAVIADLQALSALHPADVQTRYQLGLFLAARDPQAALAHLTQAADLQPSLEPVVETLVGNIRTALLAGDLAYTRLAAGRALASIGEWELAAEAFQGAVDQSPQYAEAWAYLGEARQHLLAGDGEDQAEAGLAELHKALSLDPDSLVANTFLALYWQRHGEYDRARDGLQSLTERFPDQPAFQAELGRVLAVDGELEAALDAYNRAIALAPRDPLYLRSLAEFSVGYEYQVRQVGLPAARRAAALDPYDPANMDILGQALLLLEDLTSAERLFQRAAGSGSGYPLAQVHLGLVYMLRNERSRARDQWTQVLARTPGSPAAEQAQRLIKNYFP